MPLPFSRRALQTAPSFSRDFAGLKTLDHGVGPAIIFTRASNATFFDANGTLQTAANDTPRFDHDPATGASRGLLIEEARTNSIRNSQAGGAVVGVSGTMPTNWNSVESAGLSREVVAVGTINGFSYIDIKFSGTNATGSNAQFAVNFETSTQIVASLGQTWTGFAYVGLIAGSISGLTNIQIDTVERAAAGTYLLGTQTNIHSSLTSSLQRFSSTRTFNQATVERTSHRVVANIPNGNSIDLTLRIAAPQLEQGAFATSYIPTTTAAATRAADSAVVTPISSFYNQAEGTFLVEATYYGKQPSAFSRIFSFGNLSANDPDRWFLGFNDSNTNLLMQHFTAGAFDFGSSASSSAGTIYKAAFALALNNGRSALNGSLLGSDDTSVGAPSNKDRMIIGGAPSGTGGNGLHIRRIAYWPRRLSNTLLQQLTT